MLTCRVRWRSTWPRRFIGALAVPKAGTRSAGAVQSASRPTRHGKRRPIVKIRKKLVNAVLGLDGAVPGTCEAILTMKPRIQLAGELAFPPDGKLVEIGS